MKGSDIKRIRKELGSSQLNFATMLGITQGYLSELENDKSSPSRDIMEKIKTTALYENIDIENLASEDPVSYDKKKICEELIDFESCDMIYRVTDINAVGEYKTGYILAMKEIHRKELAPIGLPYLIQTKTDRLELMRYIMAIDTEKGMVQLAMDLQGKFAQLFPLSEIDHIFTVISFMGQKM